MITLFIVCFLIVFYAYLGYGLLLYLLVIIKRIFKKESLTFNNDYLPSVTLIIAAFNEKDYILEKAKNSLALEYPKDRLQILFVTDGSTDGTPEILRTIQGVEVTHEHERKGKIAAVNRAVSLVSHDILVFTDANTELPADAIRKITQHYQNSKVGAVAGEKRVISRGAANATSGEGIYWKYESKLKQWDSELNSVVGAAGELFSLRRSLFKPAPSGAILDDFMISMEVASQGYKVVYEPEAYALEYASANMEEELKRKIRISAGGIQSVVWLSHLLNPFRYGLLSFQYISHRVLRWTIAPLALLILFVIGFKLLFSDSPILFLLAVLQLGFYGIGLLGFIFRSYPINVKGFFVPYYFISMNYALFLGFFRYLLGQQTVIWEKSKRG